MNFELDEGQRLLQESLERWAREAYDAPCRQRSIDAAGGWRPEVWQEMARLGVFGLGIDEAHGGLGGGAVDIMLATQALGQVLVVEPWLATLQCGRALGVLGTPEQQARRLPPLVAGDRLMAWAHMDQGARTPASPVQARARRAAEGWRLDGHKVLVRHGDTAQDLLVSARTAAGTVALFLVPTDSAGLSRRAYRTHDDLPAADVRLQGVLVPEDALLGGVEDADAAIRLVERLGVVVSTAEAVGLMRAMLRLTLEHLRTRQQFGAPLASFQVLQHRAVDMAVAVEQTESMALLAALSLDEAADDMAQSLAQAKVQCNTALRLVAQQSVQLHGAIGITEESRIGRLFRRATVLESESGSTAYHLSCLAG
jgi:alkylation response protein AidB-like acyl-CoA dehydrogenase